MLNVQITDTLWVAPTAVLSAAVGEYEDSPYWIPVSIIGSPHQPSLRRGGVDGWSTRAEAEAVLAAFRDEIRVAQAADADPAIRWDLLGPGYYCPTCSAAPGEPCRSDPAPTVTLGPGIVVHPGPRSGVE